MWNVTFYICRDFADGEPDNAGAGEDCVVYKPDTDNWEDDECSTDWGYICQICEWYDELNKFQSEILKVLPKIQPWYSGQGLCLDPEMYNFSFNGKRFIRDGQ